MEGKRIFMQGILKDGSDGPRLNGNRCEACGLDFFPKVEFCPHCLSEKLVDIDIASRGELYAHTVTRVKVKKFQPPHPLGIIRIPENKLSITAPLLLEEGEVPEVGTIYELVIDTYWTDEDSVDVYGYKFKKARNQPQEQL